MCYALSNLIKVCCLRGLWIRADSALTSLKRLAKELELAAPSCANSLQWVILQMHRKQLKKAGDELVPDSRLFKETHFLLLGETQGLFLTLSASCLVAERAKISLSQSCSRLFCKAFWDLLVRGNTLQKSNTEKHQCNYDITLIKAISSTVAQHFVQIYCWIRLDCSLLGENKAANRMASVMKEDRINHNKGPLCLYHLWIKLYILNSLPMRLLNVCQDIASTQQLCSWPWLNNGKKKTPLLLTWKIFIFQFSSPLADAG